jgi:ABC-type nitrate/sulfonate/bicarbonate transport system substrate-binding protein
MTSFRQSGHRLLPLSRRRLLVAGAAAGLAAPFVRSVRAAPVTIRYATGGGVGPNEMETLIYLDWMQKNVLKRYGKDYVVDMTFTRGTPEAATLMAAGQVDMATFSFAVFALSVVKQTVPGGVTIVSDNYQDGLPGYANNTMFVLEDSPIKTVQDLKGKKLAINAYGSAADMSVRVKLKQDGLDPRKDVEIVEIAFPNIGPALREKRVDCGALVVPFINFEVQKGGLRRLFGNGDAFGPYSPIFQVANNDFLKAHDGAVRAFLADYVDGLHWFYDKANRQQAVTLAAGLTKTPPAVLDSYMMTERDYYRDPNACVTAKTIQSPVDGMVAVGLLEKTVTIADYVNMSYLPMPCSK